MRRSRKEVFCVALLVFLAFSQTNAHETVAGSCSSPHSGHHGLGRAGNGTYTLDIIEKQTHSQGHSIDLILEIKSSEKGRTFRGFQIICQSCEFFDIDANVDAQLNERYCSQHGRVSHTDNSDKKSVQVKVRLPASVKKKTRIKYFVVQTLEEWYGPMQIVLDSNGTVVNRAQKQALPDAFVTMEGNDEDVDEDDGDKEETDAGQSSSIPPCQTSDEVDFDCMTKLKSNFIVHWSLRNVTTGTGTDATNSVESVEMMVVADTPGWASISFAQYKGRMYPADAVLGWIEEDATANVSSYYIQNNEIGAGDENTSLFKIPSISRQDRWLRIRFRKEFSQGNVHVVANKASFLNYATSRRPGLVEHDHRGSVELNLFTGQAQQVSARKFYETHGILAIIAWTILVPFSITAARAKWSPPGMGMNGWLELHQGLHLLAIIAVVSALFISITTFHSIESRAGRVHRVLGILIPIFMFGQIAMGILRPDVSDQRHVLFSEAHRWSGRCTVVLSWISIFVGISAFHTKLQVDVSVWIISVIVLLFSQLIVALYFEIGPGKRYRQRLETVDIGMVQIPYSRPQESDSAECYDSDSAQ